MAEVDFIGDTQEVKAFLSNDFKMSKKDFLKYWEEEIDNEELVTIFKTDGNRWVILL